MQESVIYGADGREEAYNESDDALRQSVVGAVAALIRDQDFDLRGAATPNAIWSAPSLMERRRVCASERFADQPALATCTAILVERDLVLTAGHCARNLKCGEYSLVFGFFYQGDRTPHTLDAEDVYRCREVVGYRVPSLLETLDYGWIRLDREVNAARRPLVIERVGEAARFAEPLRMLDFGAGLPLKTQRGASVVEPRADTLDYFVSDLDAFAGSSGAPVFNQQGRVLGMLASGQMDFEPSDQDCLVASRLDPGVASERVTYAFRSWEGLALAAPLAKESRAEPGCAVMARGIPEPRLLGLALLGIALSRLGRRLTQRQPS